MSCSNEPSFCRLIVTDAQSSELHAKLEAAEDNISASQEAARVAHQRKVEAEEKAAHLQEQLKELLAKAKHSVRFLVPNRGRFSCLQISALKPLCCRSVSLGVQVH